MWEEILLELKESLIWSLSSDIPLKPLLASHKQCQLHWGDLAEELVAPAAPCPLLELGLNLPVTLFWHTRTTLRSSTQNLETIQAPREASRGV